MDSRNKALSEYKEWLCRFEIQERALKVISWELNENIGQTLWLVKIQLDQLKNSLSKTNKQRASETGKILTRVIRDLKLVTKQNEADEILSSGFVAGIERELGLRRDLRNNRLQLKISGRTPAIPPVQELLIFCTIQEIISDNFNHPEHEPGLISILCKKNSISINVTRNFENESGIKVSDGARSKLEQLKSEWAIKSGRKKSIFQMTFTI